MTHATQSDRLDDQIDEALHIDWAFKGKAKPTRIIIDGSASKGAYHTDYKTFKENIKKLITTAQNSILDAAIAEGNEMFLQESGKPYSTGNGLSNIHYHPIDAVPVSTLEALRNSDTIHGLREGLCEICGNEYPTPWYAPNELWNKFMRYPDGREKSEKHHFVCPNCFITTAKQLGCESVWIVATDEQRPTIQLTKGKHDERD